MEQILLAYGLPKETVITIIMLYSNMKAKVCSPDGDIDFFNIAAGILQGDTLTLYLFILNVDRCNERKWFYPKKVRSRQLLWMQIMQRIPYFLQIHLLKLNPCCIVWSRQQMV